VTETGSFIPPGSPVPGPIANFGGVGFASAHHGEILQGVFYDDKGKLRRGLVTLRFAERGSRATFYPSATWPEIVSAPEMLKASRAASLAMEELATDHSPVIGGYIDISSNVPRGMGMGSSTADVTAAIRAIADFHGVTPSAEKISKIAVRAEWASDPIMIDDEAVLFAQREGVVLETFGHTLPGMIVVGCNADPGAACIDTLALAPAKYSVSDIEHFSFLRAELRVAVVNGDVARLGMVATCSALISERFLPKPALEFLLDVSRSCGGCGVQVAHSGTVAGVIFDSRDHCVRTSVERCIRQIEKAGLTLTGVIGHHGAVSDVDPQRR
jgi:uncharacterized protein involved in propanediol utilization